MDRRETTNLLKELLIKERFGNRTYWSREVSLDYGTRNVRRVDFVQFQPAGVLHVSDIEKGIFICYEIKSCLADIYSGNGLNFVGEKNYIVTTMECYKQLQEDMRSGKLDHHIKNCNPESSLNFGFMVPVPYNQEIVDEYENPTKLHPDMRWKLCPEFNVTIKGVTETTTLKYSWDGTWFDNNGYVYNVIAWQPLPERYKGGDDRA